MIDLVEFPLKYLNIAGYLRPNTNFQTIALLFIWKFSLVFSFIVSIVNYFYINDIYQFTDNLESTCALFQVFGQLTVCIYQKSMFLNLIEQRKNFWDTNSCSRDTKSNVSRISSAVGLLQKIFFYQSIILVVGGLMPMSLLKKKLVIGDFNISDDPLAYYVAWTFSCLSYLVTVCGFTSFDCLYFGLCYEVIAQFKILCDHLKRLSVERISSDEELEDYVDKFERLWEHHKFLLRFIQNMQDCFGIVYLIQFTSTAPFCCAIMYLAFESPGISAKIAMVVVCLNTICQLSIYCLAATYMTNEASSIAHAVYNSNWYAKHFVKLKTPIQLMIQQAQREIRITTLGGIVDINPKTLILVLRTSFSICTVLRNLKK